MLDLNIEGVVVSDGIHNGTVRVHLGEYLGPRAQEHIDEMAARNKDVSDAMLISEKQRVVLVAAKPTSSSDELKAMAKGFMRAMEEWYAELDDIDRQLLNYHPNPQREAAEAYSKAPTWHTNE